LLVYRSSPEWRPNRLARAAASNARFSSPDSDPRPWFDDNPSAPGALTHQEMVYAIQHPITGALHYPARGRCWWTEHTQILAQMREYASYELRDIDDAEKRADLCGVATAASVLESRRSCLPFLYRRRRQRRDGGSRRERGPWWSFAPVGKVGWVESRTCRPSALFHRPGGATISSDTIGRRRPRSRRSFRASTHSQRPSLKDAYTPLRDREPHQASRRLVERAGRRHQTGVMRSRATGVESVRLKLVVAIQSSGDRVALASPRGCCLSAFRGLPRARRLLLPAVGRSAVPGGRNCDGVRTPWGTRTKAGAPQGP
jgi:hypothetical protein